MWWITHLGLEPCIGHLLLSLFVPLLHLPDYRLVFLLPLDNLPSQGLSLHLPLCARFSQLADLTLKTNHLEFR